MVFASVTEKRLLLLSGVVRLLFIAYGEWQDAHLQVPYTDIDYHVFSDGAAFVAHGKSPFLRETYRYSPLLAIILVPNVWVHHACGKFLFSIADLLAGHYVHEILRLQGISVDMSCFCAALWLFNPFTFTIATRGNCEALVCAVVLRILWCILTGHMIEAAVWYGLIVHFRIYPIIYVLAILIVLDKDYPGGAKITTNKIPSTTIVADTGLVEQGAKTKIGLPSVLQLLHNIVNVNRLLFGVISGGVFLLFTGIFYYLYGDQFLYEALVYHLTRTDHRHNFSIYFYHIYLHHGSSFTLFERLLSFVPQLLVQCMLVLYYAKDIPFCFFVQTMAFVAFNKVITAQYFVWFFCLFPLIVPWTSLQLRWKGVFCISLWVTSQLHWLMWGYLLEFQGMNVFLQLWLASLAFFAANIFVLSMIIWHHNFHRSIQGAANFDREIVKIE